MQKSTFLWQIVQNKVNMLLLWAEEGVRTESKMREELAESALPPFEPEKDLFCNFLFSKSCCIDFKVGRPLVLRQSPC